MNTTRLAKIPFVIALIFMLHSCATFQPQYTVIQLPNMVNEQQTEHTFFIAGGIGSMNADSDDKALDLLKGQLAVAKENSTMLFIGNNISEEEDNWERDKSLVVQQLQLVKDFKGNTIFIPGNNEWKSYNTNKIEKVEDYLKEIDSARVSIMPNNVCPVEHKIINDKLDLIVIDSKWFISNWSRIKNINKKCTNIVTRRRFMEELEGYINDAQGKNVVIAMHHPVFSNGKFAGKDTFKSSMTPVPIVGSILNGMADLGGFDPDRLNSIRYNYLRIAVTKLAKASDRVTIVSGHEESQQYLEGGDIHQIISGALNSKTATKIGQGRINTIGGSLPYKGRFTYGEKGFAKLEYFKDGSSKVTFITAGNLTNSFSVLPELDQPTNSTNFPVITEKSRTAQIIDETSKLERSGFYKFLWGERYRKYFGTSVSAPIAMLDTLYGGVKVTKEGGGHQSYSIRLEGKNGKEYSMRSLRKNALKFLRFKIPGIAYTSDDYDDTFTEEVVSDFFTTAHPYMQLVINPLAKAVNVNHSSPELLYIPKQESLGYLNEEFGNELYYIEERPSDEQMNFKGYRRIIDERGKVKDFESTTDMFEKIKSDESYTIDQRDFIRARIFDFLIGDWDRHQDQWRWVEYEKEDGDKEFLPIPRDRDNAFPKFDGNAMKLIKAIVPASRPWQTYGPKIKNVKWLANSGNQVDRVLLTKYGSKIWEEEAKFIQKNLTKEKIEIAFLKLPKEVRDATSEEIQKNLQLRLLDLPKYAKEYSEYLDRTVALHGTEKDDKIEVKRLADGKTQVVLKRLLSDSPNEIMYDRTFDPKLTKEIWIYGLGDDDHFEVTGEEKSKIKVRLIGGYGEDIYNVTNSKGVRVYDWIHEDLKFENKKPIHQLTDVYRTNTFHWRFFEENSTIVKPNIGFRSDDGFYLGLTDTYINNGFNGSKFRQKHSLMANYYFKFNAVELGYGGIFANVIPKWKLELNGYYTNDRFSNNFFGIGNESVNDEDTRDRDFYRARMQKVRFSAGIAYHTLRFKALYESFRLEEIPDRLFIPANLSPEIFGSQNYVGGETSALYKNADAVDFPAKSIILGLTMGYKANTSIKENKFGYFKFKTGFSHKLIPSGNLVFGTLAEINTNFGNDYFFYHAPSLGGNNGLRGFRDERFSGKTYLYQTSDLRWRIKRFITAVAPITIGAYVGFDYGRVWTPNESSNIWHTSQGIGVWASGYNFLTFNAGYFNSVENNIFQVGFGFEF